MSEVVEKIKSMPFKEGLIEALELSSDDFGHNTQDLLCAESDLLQFFGEKSLELLDTITQLRRENEIYKEALESIASLHRPRHSTEEHWMSVTHEDCSIVLATDTKIARTALKDCEELK
jgi:hypothetical protein